MAVQAIEALDVLQGRLTKVLDVMAELREQSTQLQNRVHELEKEVAAKADAIARLQEDNARLVKMEEEYKQLVAEREIVRNKVEGMLKHLERFDLP
jgi:predicted nuclease with TOPRIM domain